MHRAHHHHNPRLERDTVPVSITLLGGFRVEVDGETTSPRGWARRSAAALVKVLAVAHGHRLHREEVMDLLWPNEPIDRTAPRLHKAAYFARRAAGCDDAVVLRDDIVWLFPDAELRIDVIEFERLARLAVAEDDPGAAQQALARYGGELLPADRYESWAIDRRELLHLRRLDVLRVARAWRELAELDPTDAETRLELVRHQLAAGDATAAHREYEQLERVVERELGDPGGAGPIAAPSRVGELLGELADLVRRQQLVLAELAAVGVAPEAGPSGAHR